MATFTELRNVVLAGSENLSALGVIYGLIGGVACVVLGSSRTTADVNFAVDVKADEIAELKRRIASRDDRFDSRGNSLYLKASHTIPIEMLSASPGAPCVWPNPLGGGLISIGVEYSITILHPFAILCSKVNRVGPKFHSKYPPSVTKNTSDIADIVFLRSRFDLNDVAPIFRLYPYVKQASIMRNTKILLKSCPMLGELVTILKEVQSEAL